jgi:hypothetical protein
MRLKRYAVFGHKKTAPIVGSGCSLYFLSIQSKIISPTKSQTAAAVQNTKNGFIRYIVFYLHRKTPAGARVDVYFI